MSDAKVLTQEEVDALLNLSKENKTTMENASEGGSEEAWTESHCVVNVKSLTNITDLATAECEKNLTSFFRKKIAVKSKPIELMTLSDALNGKVEKHIFSVFEINASEHYGMVAIDLILLHHVINLLYGGQIIANETIIETPGKIGILVAESICKIGLDGFVSACSEYGKVVCEILKTITAPNLTSKISMEDKVYSVDMTVTLGEIETHMDIIIPEAFVREFIPIKGKEVKHVESNFWRNAIETQVSDSCITINVTLSDVNVKINDLVSMKAGDLIPISDPTLAYVCLNKLKLFRAIAGQANSNRVVKIVSEV